MQHDDLLCNTYTKIWRSASITSSSFPDNVMRRSLPTICFSGVVVILVSVLSRTRLITYKTCAVQRKKTLSYDEFA